MKGIDGLFAFGTNMVTVPPSDKRAVSQNEAEPPPKVTTRYSLRYSIDLQAGSEKD